MLKALKKDSIKEIKVNFKRFISIMIMAFLGVGFYAGLRAAPPDMGRTLDAFFDKTECFDIQIMSTLGLTDDDVEKIKNIDGVDKVVPIYSEDVFAEISDDKQIIKLLQYSDELNHVDLVEGRLPENENECVIDNKIKIKGIKIGDTINIEEDPSYLEDDSEIEVEEANFDDEDDKEDLEEEKEKGNFKTNSLKVVGFVNSPIYLSHDRGITTIGNGSIDYYAYILKSNITNDIYTNIYVTVSGVKDLNSSEDEYKEKIKELKDRIDSIKEEREDARYNSIVGEANEKLADAEKTLEEEKAKALKEIKDAEKEIADGKKEIADNEKKIKDAENTLNSEISSAQNQITEGYNKLIASEIELNEAQRQFEETLKQNNISMEMLNSMAANYDSNLNELNTNINMINQKIKELTITLETLKSMQNVNHMENVTPQDYSGQIAQISATIENLKITLTELNTKKTQLEGMYALVSASKQLESGRAEINNGYSTLDSAQRELNNKHSEALKEIEDGRKELNKGKNKIKDAEIELADGKKEFDEKILDAEKKLIDARQKVKDLKEAKWYIQDRFDLDGFGSYIKNLDSITAIAIVFPIVFFIIATLISLTSMTRMVEEQRTLIGTLKALGYTKSQIVYKYILFASIATIVGGFLGILTCMYTLPRIIIYLYEMMFCHMDPVVFFNFKFALVGLGTMYLCIVGATIMTMNSELKNVPAELMRPKAPKTGKRVILENIKFIWNRLSFTQKVTIRNMFRYKKRFFMTIIGIAGCTGLILAGFGLKDSISSVLDLQYDHIYHYNMYVAIKDSMTIDEQNRYMDSIKTHDEVNDVYSLYVETMSIVKGDLSYDAQLDVVKDINKFKEFITIREYKNESNEFELDDESVVISSKIADLLNIKPGDEITLRNLDMEEYKVKVKGISEHYVQHNIYMTENYYNKVVDNNDTTPNVFFIKYEGNLSEEDEQNLSEKLLADSRTVNVILVSSMKTQINNILQNLNAVVYILIVAAGLLAFVVLYNLTNINISERIRELATIKVLGFYDREVYDYITREIIILTIIGIGLGVLFGEVLTGFILKTCEIDMLRFPINIYGTSILISIGLTIVFSVIVNILTYFSLKKIDMIESLKSVE
ncbi:MAG: FtsX-like permease family protein [Clostridia bacterium]|nr:FtsX-like permease family protein [Clostridia bacterium]